jgi:hypothetical protein
MRLTRSILADRKGLAAAIVAVVALGATAGMTLGGFSATIANPTNTFSSGTIQLEEGVNATTCYSTGTGAGGSVQADNTNAACAGDDLGDFTDQMPGEAESTTVTLTNVGNDPTTSSELVSTACTVAAASDDTGYVGADLAANAFCGEVDVTIGDTTSSGCIFPVSASPCPALSNTNTLASFENGSYTTLSPLAAGASATYVISVEVDPAATNADQGLTATIPLTWSITQ